MNIKDNLKKIKLRSCLCIAPCLPIIAVILCIPAETTEEHVEMVSTRTHTYQIELGGTLDEFNTAGYLEAPFINGEGRGHKRLVSKFQPNEYLIIENITNTDVVNPRIVVNGRRNWYSADDILDSVLKPSMTDTKKAMAIWTFTSSIELHAHDNDRRVGDWDILANTELANPVKWANCYYCSGCQFASAVFVVLCQQAGFPTSHTRTSAMGGHRVAEVWYDGDWHVYDSDQRTFYIEDDNTNLASYYDLHRNPSLCDRTHEGGFASQMMASRGPYYEQRYPPGIIKIEEIAPYLSTMAMTLRPGEKFKWRWDDIGKWRYGDNKRGHPELKPYQLTNGELTYEPRLGPSDFPHGTFDYNNIQSITNGDMLPQLEPVTARKVAYVVYEVSTCYPVVGGRVGATFFRNTTLDLCRIYISVYDPNNWTQVWSATSTGNITEEINIDNDLDPLLTPAIYKYYVRFELQAQSMPSDVFVKDIYVESDVQMSGTALPSLSVGTNNVVYSDESAPDAQVRITHGWNESSATIPPLPPVGPVTPSNASRIPLASLNKLEWIPATDTDGSIVDYHIQLSPRSDMLHPVSPSFDRITFSPNPEWNIPDGWLLEGQTYYWRVRARDNWGAWSNWSRVWHFTATAVLDNDPNDDNVDFTTFQKALEALDDVKAASIGDSIFEHLEQKYKDNMGFATLKSKLTAADSLTKRMISELKKATHRQMLSVADELFDKKDSNKNNSPPITPAKSFYETSTELFSKQIRADEFEDNEKTFLAQYYDLKLRILITAIAKAGQALAIAEPSFKGTYDYVLVLPLLHASQTKPVNIDVLPKWICQSSQFNILSDSCLLHYGLAYHAQAFAKQSAKLEQEEFSEEHFYRTASKKCADQFPHIAADCLQRAIDSIDEKRIDERINIQFDIVQIWLDCENFTLAAGQAKKIADSYAEHKKYGNAIWLYYYALSRANNVKTILANIDSVIANPRCSDYRFKLMYMKWWALRRQKNKTAQIAALEHQFISDYGDNVMIAPIMLSRATDLLAGQDYAGVFALLDQVQEKFPSTAAAGQAKKMAEKLKMMQGTK